MQTTIIRALWIAACLLLAPAAWAGASLVSVSGPVEIGSGAPPAWRAAQAGDALAPGDAIRTGAGARAEIRLGDQRVARLYERSLLRIGAETTERGSVRSVELGEGVSLFDLLRRAVVDEFDVRTPEIVVSVKGTRFLVEASPEPDLAAVFRGEVALRGGELAEIAVRPGFTGRLGELEPTPFPDPWDAWESGAPAPRHEPSHVLEHAELSAALALARAGASEAEGSRLLDGAAGRTDGARDALGANELLDGVADVAAGTARSVTQATDLLGAVLGGATELFPFDFDVNAAASPTVTLSIGGQSVTLDQGMIDTVLAGDTTPLGTLTGPIATLGVDPVELAGFLDSLF